MARRHRLHIAGLSQHVIQRGSNRSDIFKSYDDYQAFLMFLGLALERHRLDLHGYALMKNHVHLLVTPRLPTSVSRAMHSVGFRYVQYFNRTHARTGALFEGRYRATVIDSERYWLTCLRYVELNPVRAGIVTRPEAYSWSSYAANATGIPDRLISPHPSYEALGRDAEERQRQWRAICQSHRAADDLETLRPALHRGGVLGAVVIPAAPCDPSQD